eukprot:m.76114 g.76114  ORF g.76114 m.76114 type:complete len:71 (-) comp50437_c0_seq4:174-386(-)
MLLWYARFASVVRSNFTSGIGFIVHTRQLLVKSLRIKRKRSCKVSLEDALAARVEEERNGSTERVREADC